MVQLFSAPASNFFLQERRIYWYLLQAGTLSICYVYLTLVSITSQYEMIKHSRIFAFISRNMRIASGHWLSKVVIIGINFYTSFCLLLLFLQSLLTRLFSFLSLTTVFYTREEYFWINTWIFIASWSLYFRVVPAPDEISFPF